MFTVVIVIHLLVAIALVGVVLPVSIILEPGLTFVSKQMQDGLGYSSGTCIGDGTFFGRRAGRKAAR